MKRKRFSAVLGLILAFAVVAGFVFPLASAETTVTVLNPKGVVEPLDNQPLTDRLSSLDDADIALVYYAKDANKEAMTALGEMLEDEFDAQITALLLANEWDEVDAATYDQWAGYDAVIFGVADTNSTAWWSAYHAKMVESLGTPTVVLTNSTYEATQYYASEDNGFTSMRRAVMNRQNYGRAYARLNGAVETVFGLSVFTTGLNYMENEVLNKTNADPARFKMFEDITTTKTVYEQVVWALTGALTPEEKAPPAITADQIMDIENEKTFTITADNVYKAEDAFNEFALEHHFGDGLPLIMPTEQLVDEMLAATTRGRDEVLGKMKMRGGIITVEKVAINSVMAGARPEYFPVILSAMEAYASAWEDARMYWHAFSSDDLTSFMLLLNGPLGKELGIEGRIGYGGSGNMPNNLIGRAFRLCVLNIGLNKTPTVDSTARYGRMNDIALMVTREFEEDLPAGWRPHSEMMGYAPGQSTVTLIAIGADVSFRYFGGQDNEYALQALVQDIRNHLDDFMTSVAIVAMPSANINLMADFGVQTYDDAGNIVLNDYKLDTKEKFQEHLMTFGTRESPSSYTATLSVWRWGAPVYEGPDANRLQSPKLIYPIALGEDPAFGRIFGVPYYGTAGYQVQLITGATLTAAGKDATALSAPLNFKAEQNRAGDSVALSWDAPASGTVTKYQVSKDDGVTWTDVPAGQMTYTFDDLTINAQYFFVVRAINSVINSAEIVGSGIYALETDTRAISNQASGRGAWASEMLRTAPITTKVYITGPADVVYLPGETATYTVSLADATDVTAVQLTLRVDGSFFETKNSGGLNGFFDFDSLVWVNVGGDMWEGTVMLASDGNSGSFDVFQIEFNLKGELGTTTVELVDFKIAYEGDWVDYDEGCMSVETSINQWFSPYDLNSDGVVDLRDISVAMMYYMAQNGDSNWTVAQIADVNGDGIVDIEDLVLIRANFT